jgi:hypothetical protein
LAIQAARPYEAIDNPDADARRQHLALMILEGFFTLGTLANLWLLCRM